MISRKGLEKAIQRKEIYDPRIAFAMFKVRLGELASAAMMRGSITASEDHCRGRGGAVGGMSPRWWLCCPLSATLAGPGQSAEVRRTIQTISRGDAVHTIWVVKTDYTCSLALEEPETSE